MEGDRALCTASRKDGAPCENTIVGASGYCFAHDPQRREELRAGQQAGGRGKATTVRLGKLIPATLRPVLETLLSALNEVHGGDIEPPVANALASLAGAIVKVYGAGQLEERLEALEAAAAGLRRLA